MISKIGHDVRDHGSVPIEDSSVDLVITSPPYKKKEGNDTGLMESLGLLIDRVLKPDGLAFVNLGQLSESFRRQFEVPLEIEVGSLKIWQTQIWVKSHCFDGPRKGHVTPINSKRILDFSWEYVYQYRKGNPELDKLAVGVPYADQGNLNRGDRGKNGDVRCAGDVFFIPYSTKGKTAKKAHQYEYPEKLVERLIKLSGKGAGSVVLDPFAGSGTTLKVAESMGLIGIGIDKAYEE